MTKAIPHLDLPLRVSACEGLTHQEVPQSVGPRLQGVQLLKVLARPTSDFLSSDRPTEAHRVFFGAKRTGETGKNEAGTKKPTRAFCLWETS